MVYCSFVYCQFSIIKSHHFPAFFFHSQVTSSHTVFQRDKMSIKDFPEMIWHDDDVRVGVRSCHWWNTGRLKSPVDFRCVWYIMMMSTAQAQTWLICINYSNRVSTDIVEYHKEFTKIISRGRNVKITNVRYFWKLSNFLLDVMTENLVWYLWYFYKL